MNRPTNRVASIDVFRALTMFLMIFVNDLWSLSGIPSWLEHSKAHQDFLGIADVVFPGFLFILGMAIPYAIRNRLAKVENNWQILKHIVFRSFALLVMGVFIVNSESMDSDNMVVSSTWFELLMVSGFFLIWNVYPKTEDWKKYLFVGLQIIGVCLLVWLAFVFKGENHHGDEPGSFSPRWWGILGLIGWTYLVCAIVYLFARNKPVYIVIAWAVATFLCISNHGDILEPILSFDPGNWLVGNGAFHSFSFAGMIGGILLDKYYNPEKFKKLLIILVSLGIVMLIAGLISRHYFIISKLLGTPTWVFLCCAISFGLFGFIHWLVDVKKKANWFSVIKPAGTNTLTCYLVPYFVYNIVNLTNIQLPEVLLTGWVGLIKTLVYCFIVVGVTAVLARVGVKLKI